MEKHEDGISRSGDLAAALENFNEVFEVFLGQYQKLLQPPDCTGCGQAPGFFQIDLHPLQSTGLNQPSETRYLCGACYHAEGWLPAPRPVRLT